MYFSKRISDGSIYNEILPTGRISGVTQLPKKLPQGYDVSGSTPRVVFGVAGYMSGLQQFLLPSGEELDHLDLVSHFTDDPVLLDDQYNPISKCEIDRILQLESSYSTIIPCGT
jgi:hypothetical protein